LNLLVEAIDGKKNVSRVFGDEQLEMSDENPFNSVLEALDTPPIKEDTPQYEALVRFITSYVNAEAALHMLARKLSGMSDEKARAIFGSMRLSDIIRVCSLMPGLDPGIHRAEPHGLPGQARQ
jgi:hypothetical protein